MRWSLAWPSTEPECSDWTARRLTTDPVQPEGGSDTYIVDLASSEQRDSRAVFEAAAERLFRYDIFPPELMRARVCTSDGRIATDAVIVQRVRIGAFVLESAVIVVEVWRSSDDAGFAYGTLEGHPERGISRFRVVREGPTVRFEIEAVSRPASVLTWIGRPLGRRFQRAATRAALRHFASG